MQPKPHRPAAPGAWWICGLLLAGTVLNYLDRQVLSLTAEKIIADFGIDKEGFGHILSAFRYSYAVTQIAGGWLVDSVGARAIYPAAVGLWSLAGIATAFATSLGGLRACRFVLGIGEAFNWPCALKVTERLLPEKDRPLANGIFNSGTALGAMLAPLVVTILTVRYGWRSAFIATGVLGFVWVVVWLAYTRPFAPKLKSSTLRTGDAPGVMLRILRKRSFWALAVSAVIVNSVSYVLADWIPLYLKTERGFSFAVGNALSVMVYAGLDAGNLISGFYVRRMVARGWTVARARNRALFVSCVLMSAAALTGLAPRFAALVCLVLTAIGVAGFLVIYLSLVQNVDPRHVGACSGLLGGLGNLSYGIVSPYIGRLADLNQTGITLLLAGVLPWLALASIRLGFREERS
jgi:MFS transporter, ACS family, hexuronate transporter